MNSGAFLHKLFPDESQFGNMLMDKNPLESIENTKTINSEILKGKFFDRNLVNDMLSEVKKANNKIPKVDIIEFK